MAEIDTPAVSFMKVDPEARRGYPVDVVKDAYVTMERTGEGDPGMLDAMNRIITYPDDSPAAFTALREEGRTLIGIQRDRYYPTPGPLDGVFYAEGTGNLPRPHDDAFSAVRMGMWLRRTREPEDGFVSAAARRFNLTRKVVGMSLRNTEDLARNTHPDAWGVPVARDTVLSSFPNRGSGVDSLVRQVLGPAEGSTYGHWRDWEAVADLEVPESLKTLLLRAVIAAHRHGRYMSFDERIRQLGSMMGTGRVA